MTLVAIVQARQGSTRLPGKTLRPLRGRPVLLHVLDRVNASGVDRTIVATTTSPLDDAIEQTAKDAGFACFRGSEDDVLDRYRGAAAATGADAVLRVTADCPLHDPRVIDRVLDAFRDAAPDYASNVHPPTFPDGLDTEVFTRDALEAAWREARRPSEREHVTPFLWKQPQRFRLVNVAHDRNLNRHRWVLDTETDFAFIDAVYAALGTEGKIFGMEDVLRLLATRPELVQLNRGIVRNEGYERSLREDAASKAGRPDG